MHVIKAQCFLVMVPHYQLHIKQEGAWISRVGYAWCANRCVRCGAEILKMARHDIIGESAFTTLSLVPVSHTERPGLYRFKTNRMASDLGLTRSANAAR